MMSSEKQRTQKVVAVLWNSGGGGGGRGLTEVLSIFVNPPGMFLNTDRPTDAGTVCTTVTTPRRLACASFLLQLQLQLQGGQHGKFFATPSRVARLAG